MLEARFRRTYDAPEAPEELTTRFRDADENDRRMIFATLAAAYPAGARRLRDDLTETERDGLVIVSAGTSPIAPSLSVA